MSAARELPLVGAGVNRVDGARKVAGDAPDTPGLELVMSSQAYRDYRVGGPPFLTVAAADGVRTESVAWGLEQTLQTALSALPARER